MTLIKLDAIDILILSLSAEGKSDAEIAEHLVFSDRAHVGRRRRRATQHLLRLQGLISRTGGQGDKALGELVPAALAALTPAA